MKSRLLGSLCLVFAFQAMPALAGGPPMLAVEMPAKAFDKPTQGAAVIVRASQCGEPLAAEVAGRAEGVVAGKRRTIPLRMGITSREGTWAVTRQWPDEGRWILVFTVDSHGRATAMVDLPAPDVAGAAAKIELVHRRVEAKEIDERLSG